MSNVRYLFTELENLNNDIKINNNLKITIMNKDNEKKNGWSMRKKVLVTVTAVTAVTLGVIYRKKLIGAAKTGTAMVGKALKGTKAGQQAVEEMTAQHTRSLGYNNDTRRENRDLNPRREYRHENRVTKVAGVEVKNQ